MAWWGLGWDQDWDAGCESIWLEDLPKLSIRKKDPWKMLCTCLAAWLMLHGSWRIMEVMVRSQRVEIFSQVQLFDATCSFENRWGSPSDIDRAGGIGAVLDRLRLDGVTEEQPVSSLSGGEKAWKDLKGERLTDSERMGEFEWECERVSWEIARERERETETDREWESERERERKRRRRKLNRHSTASQKIPQQTHSKTVFNESIIAQKIGDYISNNAK